jgi:hypothetical protein
LKSMLHCQLLLPLARHPAAAVEHAPVLGTLLRHARRQEERAEDADAWLCRRFAVARQQDWPAAPFAALGDGLQAGDGYWLCAAPVSLALQRDSFALTESTPALRLEQAQQLVDALNAHFAADGMHFYAADARRWYLNLAQRPDLRTHPLTRVMGRDVQPFLPQGADGLKWHGLLNELQMLLHGHPLNADLEEQGVLPVNSVWLWGGGELAAGLPQRGWSVWTDDVLARGLALAHECRTAALPASAQEWWRQADDAMEQLLVLPSESLTRLEQDWFAPLLDMLRKGQVARLTLHLVDETVNSFTVTRTDLWKFWHRARPLENYLG